ncbi:hypothetical protein TNIN_111131 [Trichonephila inaurata madagascariensis]|uniref:Uncharacterized protein n=1 Tax=Trichonephila inaurata madagascariensis TaxID=2747483 RepID=A0A8X6Y1T6_9ARAC|nr:hypothetical protein TNIN_111131 [Trichonephila inaurata madagascariensis]
MQRSDLRLERILENREDLLDYVERIPTPSVRDILYNYKSQEQDLKSCFFKFQVSITSIILGTDYGIGKVSRCQPCIFIQFQIKKMI